MKALEGMNCFERGFLVVGLMGAAVGAVTTPFRWEAEERTEKLSEAWRANRLEIRRLRAGNLDEVHACEVEYLDCNDGVVAERIDDQRTIWGSAWERLYTRNLVEPQSLLVCEKEEAMCLSGID